MSFEGPALREDNCAAGLTVVAKCPSSSCAISIGVLLLPSSFCCRPQPIRRLLPCSRSVSDRRPIPSSVDPSWVFVRRRLDKNIFVETQIRPYQSSAGVPFWYLRRRCTRNSAARHYVPKPQHLREGTQIVQGLSGWNKGPHPRSGRRLFCPHQLNPASCRRP